MINSKARIKEMNGVENQEWPDLWKFSKIWSQNVKSDGDIFDKFGHLSESRYFWKLHDQ